MVVGSSYIAVELASILASLGTRVHMVVLHDHVFMQFDRMISEEVTRSLERDGVRLEKNVTVKKVGTAVGNIFQ